MRTFGAVETDRSTRNTPADVLAYVLELEAEA
jgi:hypothetical protein